jgi:hypothetical protein
VYPPAEAAAESSASPPAEDAAEAAFLYRVARGYSDSSATPTTTANSSTSLARNGVNGQSAPTPATTPRASENTGSGSAEDVIELEDLVDSAKPFQTVRIQGTYAGEADTSLQVQRREEGRWVNFPIPIRTDRLGQFSAYVELGRPGRYPLRVLDPDSGAKSKTFVLVINAK